MVSKAEERALEAFPELNREDYFDEDEWIEANVRQHSDRALYRIAYRQAEKDIALTWEDIEAMDNLLWELCGQFTDRTSGEYYQEVLKRFLESKKV